MLPDPAVLGARLQLPLVQQRQLLQFSELLQWLKTPLYPDMASWSAAGGVRRWNSGQLRPKLWHMPFVC